MLMSSRNNIVFKMDLDRPGVLDDWYLIEHFWRCLKVVRKSCMVPNATSGYCHECIPGYSYYHGVKIHQKDPKWTQKTFSSQHSACLKFRNLSIGNQRKGGKGRREKRGNWITLTSLLPALYVNCLLTPPLLTYLESSLLHSLMRYETRK